MFPDQKAQHEASFLPEDKDSKALKPAAFPSLELGATPPESPKTIPGHPYVRSVYSETQTFNDLEPEAGPSSSSSSSSSSVTPFKGATLASLLTRYPGMSQDEVLACKMHYGAYNPKHEQYQGESLRRVIAARNLLIKGGILSKPARLEKKKRSGFILANEEDVVAGNFEEQEVDNKAYLCLEARIQELAQMKHDCTNRLRHLQGLEPSKEKGKAVDPLICKRTKQDLKAEVKALVEEYNELLLQRHLNASKGPSETSNGPPRGTFTAPEDEQERDQPVCMGPQTLGEFVVDLTQGNDEHENEQERVEVSGSPTMDDLTGDLESLDTSSLSQLPEPSYFEESFADMEAYRAERQRRDWEIHDRS